MKDKTLIIMGNGPSLKDVDFDFLSMYDTFGLNSACRAYDRLNWWPTYHGCFDYIMTDTQKEEFIDLINTQKIKKHFYIRNLSDKANFQYINLLQYGSSNKINKSVNDFQSFNDNGNSGANASSVGICLGYKKIILLGVDCNYVEEIKESSTLKNGVLKLNETPKKNPNYWFNDYQRAGDIYNIPAGLSFHMPTWNHFAYRACQVGVEVINCSPITKLRGFKRMTLKEALL
jgi:hypothetical protein